MIFYISYIKKKKIVNIDENDIVVKEFMEIENKDRIKLNL